MIFCGNASFLRDRPPPSDSPSFPELKVIIHFAALAAADSNHEQEWGLIKSGQGERETRREEEPQFATGAHFLSSTKRRNYEAGGEQQDLA